MRIRPLVFVLSFAQMFGQDAAVALKQRSIGTPTTMQPEPQRELKRTPLSRYSDLLGTDGGTLEDSTPVPDATLRAVELDNDNEPEYILTLRSVVPLESTVLVMDCVDHRWRVIGQFRYWYVWDAEKALDAGATWLPKI